jgi:hypothetical protein
MLSSPDHAPPPVPSLVQTPALQAGLTLLLEAHDFACEHRRSAWDFAVEIQSLRELGVTKNMLRWLLCAGYLDHATERPSLREGQRDFAHSDTLRLTEHSCFVLTEAGVAIARSSRKPLPQGVPGKEAGRAPAARQPARDVPLWNDERRELWWRGQLVKRFRQPARNQVTVLSAFQEEGWPPRIDNPLPPQHGQDDGQRLHDAIVKLNQNQYHRLLRFRADGTGQGVCWETAGGSDT